MKLSVSHLLFIPVNLDHHWTLLVCDTKQRRFEYYDSLFHDRGRDVVKVRERCRPSLSLYLARSTCPRNLPREKDTAHSSRGLVRVGAHLSPYAKQRFRLWRLCLPLRRLALRYYRG